MAEKSTNQYFTGTYLHTIDDHGRVALPSKLRERLGDSIVITNGHGQCLAVYPEPKWQSTADALLSNPGVDESENDKRLFYFGDSWPGDVDKQGRVSIPDYLRTDAGLGVEVAIVGAGDNIQIWDKDAWIARRAAQRQLQSGVAGARPGDKPAP
jgi:MraZ protein